jgi:hypothetical protein
VLDPVQPELFGTENVEELAARFNSMMIAELEKLQANN